MFSPKAPRRPSSPTPVFGLLLGMALLGAAAFFVGGSLPFPSRGTSPSPASKPAPHPEATPALGQNPSEPSRAAPGRIPAERDIPVRAP